MNLMFQKVILETTNSYSSGIRSFTRFISLQGGKSIFLNNFLGRLLNKLSKVSFFTPKFFNYSITMLPDLYTGMGKNNLYWIHDSLYFEEELVFGNNKCRFDFEIEQVLENAKKAKFVLTPSSYSKSKLISYLNIPAEKIVVVSLQLDKIDFLSVIVNRKYLESVKVKYCFDSNNFNILFVGSAHYRKNLKTIYAVFKRLQLKKANLRLFVVSYPSREVEGSLELFDELSVDESVVICSHISRDEVVALMHFCNLFLNLSLEEGFGLPCIEAQICKLPLIVSDLPFFHEILGQSAIFVNPLDIDAVVNKVLDFINNPSSRIPENSVYNNVQKYTLPYRYNDVMKLLN
jgi:glycosyltransferase involved in cell wall biosynthesis